jgi:hypothetical protein
MDLRNRVDSVEPSFAGNRPGKERSDALMSRRLLIVLTAVMILLPTAAFADHSWANYHWGRTANPFTLKAHDNVTAVWEPYLQEAADDWNPSTVLDVSIQWGQPLSNAKRCVSANGRIEVCNSKYGNNGWLGLASIWISGDHITKAYTKVNDTYFNTATYNTPAWQRLVMCQEIAHDFGLDHQDEAFNNPTSGVHGLHERSRWPSDERASERTISTSSRRSIRISTPSTPTILFDDTADRLLRPPTMKRSSPTRVMGAPVRFNPDGLPTVFS